MGFLDKLWDETVAGPTPETGLAKLRKHKSFPANSPAMAVESPPALNQVKVSRSITILRNNNNNNNNNNKNTLAKSLSVDIPGSGPASPSSTSCTTPLTPGTPAENFRRWRSVKSPAAPSGDQRMTAHDWIVISALDR